MIQTREEFEELCRSERPEDLQRLRTEVVSSDAALAIRESPVEVRKWLVLNKSIGSEVLRHFVGDPDRSVRSCVAKRRRAGAEILGTLAQDVDASVRATVAWNPKTPESVLNALLGDREEIVRRAANDSRQRRQSARDGR